MSRALYTPRLRLFTGLAVAIGLSLSGCGGQPREISEQRTVSAPAQGRSGEDSAARFGFSGGGMREQAATPYTWNAPRHWTALPPAPLRPANFRIGPDGSTECYMTVLESGGGGVPANVNRWREQLGLGPLEEAEIAELPRIGALGTEALLFDFEGVYSGMGDTPKVAQARMLGAMLMDGSAAVFLKMVGPTEVVAEEREHFLDLVRSLDRVGSESTAWDQHAQGDWVHPPMGGDVGDAHAALFQSARPAGLQWETPEGWTRAPDRPVRLATFLVGPDRNVECYVTVLGGGAGGVSANLNRWREEMGQPHLTSAELASLPVLEMAGRDAALLEVTGDFAGKMGGQLDRAMLLGVVCPLDDQVLFVKLTGPEDMVRPERDNFIRFCESLRLPDSA